jgi:hypothetical protein
VHTCFHFLNVSGVSGPPTVSDKRGTEAPCPALSLQSTLHNDLSSTGSEPQASLISLRGPRRTRYQTRYGHFIVPSCGVALFQVQKHLVCVKCTEGERFVCGFCCSSIVRRSQPMSHSHRSRSLSIELTDAALMALSSGFHGSWRFWDQVGTRLLLCSPGDSSKCLISLSWKGGRVV